MTPKNSAVHSMFCHKAGPIICPIGNITKRIVDQAFLLKLKVLHIVAASLPTRFLIRFGSFWMECHSTRQRRRLRNSSVPTGVARHTDYFYFSSAAHNLYSLQPRLKPGIQRSVFIHAGLDPSEITSVLGHPSLSRKRVSLLIAGCDRTFPNQVDLRIGPNSPEETRFAEALLSQSSLSRISVENADIQHPRVQPVPAGIWPQCSTNHGFRKVEFASFPKNWAKPLAFCSHRVAEGPQHDERRKVYELAESGWSTFSTVVKTPMRHSAYLSELRNHPFTYCVKGGGLDLSPKAFEALLSGSIPIAKRSSVDGAYDGLPIYWVDDWVEHEISEEKLRDFYLSLDRFDYWDAVRTLLSERYWRNTILR